MEVNETKLNDLLGKVVVPNSELKFLPKASHGLQGENPKDFNKHVSAFLNDVD